MTELLTKAFAEAAKLPEEEQDVIAALILKEIESEERWQTLFVASRDEMARLAEEALDEYRSGKSVLNRAYGSAREWMRRWSASRV